MSFLFLDIIYVCLITRDISTWLPLNCWVDLQMLNQFYFMDLGGDGENNNNNHYNKIYFDSKTLPLTK